VTLRKVLLLVAVGCLAPFAAEAGGARLFASSYLTAGGAATSTVCTVTNAGSKAVRLGLARAFRAPPDAPVVPGLDECSLATLEPLESCRFAAVAPGLMIGGGYVEVLGDSRSLRGQCTLVDGGGAPVLSSDMR
jgi:hypothetical protein